MEVKKENSRVKDPADKAVLKKPENFAGIFNLALTGGKVNLVKAEELVELDPNKVVFFDAQGNIPTGEKRMDVEKEWIFKSHSNGQVVYAMRLHLEVQSTVDFFMPVRALIYSAAEYDEQMRRIKRRRKCEKFIPVLPLIANLSLTPWSGYRSFQECLEIPCLLKPYVSDYIPDFKLLIVEPQVDMDYSILPSEVGIPFRVFAAVNDLNKILVMVNEEKILNGISDDAYNMIRSRIDLDFMRRKNETMKKIDVFKETEKRLKKESAKIEAEKNKVIAEKNKITAEKNKLDIQRSELDAKRSELDVQKSELDVQRSELDVQKSELDVQKSELDAKKSELDVQKSELDVQKSELDVQKSELDVQKSELDVQKSDLDAKRESIAFKLKRTAENLLKRGFSYEDISSISGLEISEIQQYASVLAEKEPEYSVK